MIAAAAVCLVVAISDGDTLKARCGEQGGFRQEVIRLAEIDAPEKGQPYARRSTAYLALLCMGSWATVKPEKVDQYGRTVARVECRGKDASSEQARNGYAWYFTRYSTDPKVRELEGAARASKAGLWADPAPVAPWDYRATKRAARWP